MATASSRVLTPRMGSGSMRLERTPRRVASVDAPSGRSRKPARRRAKARAAGKSVSYRISIVLEGGKTGPPVGPVVDQPAMRSALDLAGSVSWITVRRGGVFCGEMSGFSIRLPVSPSPTRVDSESVRERNSRSRPFNGLYRLGRARVVGLGGLSCARAFRFHRNCGGRSWPGRASRAEKTHDEEWCEWTATK